MKTSQIEFTGALGETLSARLDEPEKGVQAFAFFSHCFTCSKDLHVVHRISKVLTEHGFAVLAACSRSPLFGQSSRS